MYFPLFFLFFLAWKKSLKSFGWSRGSKGQGSNHQNRFNECCSLSLSLFSWLDMVCLQCIGNVFVNAVGNFVCVCCSLNPYSLIGLTLLCFCKFQRRKQWATSWCKTPWFFSFWLPPMWWFTQNLVANLGERCEQQLSPTKTPVDIHHVLASWQTCFFWFRRSPPHKKDPLGSRSNQDLCKRNDTQMFQDKLIWWKMVEVSGLNISQGRLGAFRLNSKNVF